MSNLRDASSENIDPDEPDVTIERLAELERRVARHEQDPESYSLGTS